MPIYRSDQAQMTFAVEAAPGGSPELASVVTNDISPYTATTDLIPGAMTVALSGSNGGNMEEEEQYYYKYTFVDTDNNIETEVGTISSGVLTTTAIKQTVLSNIVAGPTGTNQRYIYRTKAGNFTDYYFVKAITNNNVTTDTDNIADGSLGHTAPASGLVNLTTHLPAGSRSIPVAQGFATIATHTNAPTASNTHFSVGDFIQIGPKSGIAAAGQAATGFTGAIAESEIRRIEFLDGTTSILLDTPTAFYHEHLTHIQRVTAVTDTTADKLITIVPGVYETVEVPDPEMQIEPRYFLGTESKRNFYSAYKGQQTFTGSLGGFVLLDGKALRFPIGKVTTLPMETDDTTHAILGVAITIGSTVNKGDTFVVVTVSHGLVANDYAVFYGAASDSSAEAIATAEVRKVISSGAALIQLDAPLQFPHATGDHVKEVDTASLAYYKHSILETVDLDSMSWHVHVRDSSETDANDFDRRYHGGKVGSMSLTAEEGGLLTCSWDGVNFLGMNHNQKLTTDHAASPSNVNVPFYTLMQPIRSANATLPTTEPYYFSQGQVTLFGSVVARVRSFTLSVNNNEEPRYYLKRTMGRHRGPTEIMEQRREYTCSITMALPDAGASLTSTSANSVFKDLLLEGDFGSGMQGFAIELRFDRGADDNIVITIPDDGVAGTGGNNQGAFINTAPHAITDANPMEVDASIIFRNMKIIIQDSVPVYV
jgi:hypothetical protein